MVEELYQEQIKPLSLQDRLALVQLIMADIVAATPRWTVEYDDVWSDDDLVDVTHASAAYLSKIIKMTTMPSPTVIPGDVVTADFPGVTGIKRRPAVVISTEAYHVHRPDVVLGIPTSQVNDATTPMDYLLQDWRAAGLNRLTAFRAFFATLPAVAVLRIGHCSERDWREIQLRLSRAVAMR